MESCEGLEGVSASRRIPARNDDSGLEVSVVFTSDAHNLTAFQTAAGLATDLGARMEILVPETVGFPAPLTTPPVLVEWNEERLREIAKASPVETRVQVYLCRDRTATVLEQLKDRSLVVVAGKKRWWLPTFEQRLTRKLRRAGHEVVFARIR